MNKAEAVSKVRSLIDLRDSTNFEGERDAAQHHIDRLSRKFHITNADLAERADDPTAYWSHLYQERERARRSLDFILTNIRREVDKALNNLSDVDPGGQAKLLSEFYKELRLLVEGSTSWSYRTPLSLKERRNTFIKAAYEDDVEKYKAERDKWHQRWPEDEAAIDWDKPYQRRQVHEHARSDVAKLTGLRVTDIDRIVGINMADLWKAEVEAYENEG